MVTRWLFLVAQRVGERECNGRRQPYRRPGRGLPAAAHARAATREVGSSRAHRQAGRALRSQDRARSQVRTTYLSRNIT